MPVPPELLFRRKGALYGGKGLAQKKRFSSDTSGSGLGGGKEKREELFNA